MQEKKKWYTSIIAILVAFWLFFPLGFVLIYLRLKDSHGKFYALTKELYWTGILWGGFGLLYLGISIMENNFVNETLPAGLFIFIIPGAICFFIGNKRNKKIKIYDKYITYISSRRKIKIDGLCSSVGTDYETAIKIIEEMISKELINGYIENDELIMKNIGQVSENIIEGAIQNKETKIVKCKECGAKNTVVVGQPKECDYCGTILQ